MTHAPAHELEQLVAERAAAVGRRDADALLARQHPQVLAFPLLPPAASRGPGATARSLQAWFEGYTGGPGYETRLVQAEVEGDLGWCAYVYRVTGTLDGGDEVDMWVRSTLVCRRTDAGWQVVHSHESVPFDAASGDALLQEAPPTDLLPSDGPLS